MINWSTWIPEVVAAVAGAFLYAAAYYIFRAIAGYLSRNKAIKGKWDSWWGPTVDDVKRYHEVIEITDYSVERIRGRAKRDSEPGKEWELEGRFDGHYLQMYYYPSKRSKRPNYTDYGCYFFVPEGRDSMVGLSCGKGPDEDTGKETITTEHCLIKKK
jgi:hypothetical protein